ncbi:hypothetical protein BSKO_04528 [Bryopsis sp. KO-2023]|nr:hypothetical protein BSKO_04528 [Bryopsis sp. KO-2023]
MLRKRILEDLTRSARSLVERNSVAGPISLFASDPPSARNISTAVNTKSSAKFFSTGVPFRMASTENQPTNTNAPANANGERLIVFVLGGPGSGKGTQCSRLVEEFDVVHLSAGELLRAHMASGSPEGVMIADIIKEGKIVPSEVTIRLLQKAMDDSGCSQFLIDGFPRNSENQQNFVTITGMDCHFVLFFDCPESVMQARLLSRKEGRTDDNIETIKKRFKTFVESTMPVVQHYEKIDKVRRVDGNMPPNQVSDLVMKFFQGFKKREKELAAV